MTDTKAKPVAVVAGATSKWQSDGLTGEGHLLVVSAIDGGVRMFF